MSGHSQFANIKHRKDAQDAKKAKVFVKISKEITIAVKKFGPDLNSNSTLRTVIEKAKLNNMSKSTYLKIIQRAVGLGNSKNYNNVMYEGYGPNGVAFIINCLTDNQNRTTANIRSYFNKVEGSLGQNNSVNYLFEQKGLIGFNDDFLTEEKVLNWVVENECDDLKCSNNNFLITTNLQKFEEMKKFLFKQNIKNFDVCEIIWIPIVKITNNSNLISEKINQLIDLLNNDEDVENFYHNLA